MRAALDFLRAPVFLCRAPFCTALSIFETRSRCSVGDRVGVARLDRALEAAEMGLDRAGEQPVLVRSRSLRRIRFFCEAMLAMSHVPERAMSQLRAAADYSD